jgi:outer membrane receptor for monomeric catechols
VTDDTAAVQAALNNNIGKLIFVDAGTYILTRTVVIPSGTKLIGETWSQFAASGPYFSDAWYVHAAIQGAQVKLISGAYFA